MRSCIILALSGAVALWPQGAPRPRQAVAAAAEERNGVLRVVDAKSGSEVVLVGTMHYNPHSIALTKKIVAQEAAAGKLVAVAVESCPTRWNATLKMQPAGSFLRSLCDNEMQAGAEAGEELAGAKTALVDQTIEDTGARAVQILRLTLAELCSPWNGGWGRIGADLGLGFAQVNSAGGLGLSSILDPRLLVGFPISLVRYPLAIGIKSPLFLALVASLYVLVTGGDEPPPEGDVETLIDLAETLAFVALETAVLGRVLLVGLLEERNFVLARNIRRACLEKPGGTVVGVLGMAHLNGVRSLLKESRIV